MYQVIKEKKANKQTKLIRKKSFDERDKQFKFLLKSIIFFNILRSFFLFWEPRYWFIFILKDEAKIFVTLDRFL